MCKIIQVINYKQFANILTVSVSIFVKVYLLVYMYIPLFSLILINIYCISIIVLYSKLDYFGSYVMRKTNDT